MMSHVKKGNARKKQIPNGDDPPDCKHHMTYLWFQRRNKRGKQQTRHHKHSKNTLYKKFSHTISTPPMAHRFDCTIRP